MLSRCLRPTEEQFWMSRLKRLSALWLCIDFASKLVTKIIMATGKFSWCNQSLTYDLYLALESQHLIDGIFLGNLSWYISAERISADRLVTLIKCAIFL